MTTIKKHSNRYIDHLLNTPVGDLVATPEELADMVTQDFLDRADIACDDTKRTNPRSAQELWESVFANIKQMHRETK